MSSTGTMSGECELLSGAVVDFVRVVERNAVLLFIVLLNAFLAGVDSMVYRILIGAECINRLKVIVMKRSEIEFSAVMSNDDDVQCGWVCSCHWQ